MLGRAEAALRKASSRKAVAAGQRQRDVALGMAGGIEHADAADDLVASAHHSYLVPDAREMALRSADDSFPG